MGLLDIFKKKEEPTYDVTNLTVEDLKMGFILEYDLNTWEVKEEYEYDWGNHNFSKEYLINNGSESLFLSVENKGDVFLTATKKIKIRELGSDIIDRTVADKTPPKEIKYNDVNYYLHSDVAGFCNDLSKKKEDWEELMAWEYYDDDEELVIGITQWGEREFDAVAGKVVKAFEVSNIIPGAK
ncbi:MAG: DUF4178 domain-containing protein [Reichenbachiella sp.]